MKKWWLILGVFLFVGLVATVSGDSALNLLKTTTITSLTNIWDVLSDLIVKTENLENKLDKMMNEHHTNFQEINKRLTSLEESSDGFDDIPDGGSSEIFPKYLMKLSPTTRKKIVCSYGEDNHLYAVAGLGYNCGISYKTSARGKVTAKCTCTKN